MTNLAEWHYDPAGDLDATFVERLRRFPREPDMLQYAIRSAAALGIRAWLRLYHRIEINGREHLPSDRSFVMVANHASHLDALCLLSAVPLRRLHQAFPAAAADYFFQSLPRIAVASLIVNALPFHRQIQVRQSMSVCRQLLAGPGNILIIFPEGTRSPSGRLGPFKRGIGDLLAGLDVPVVPCRLEGTFEALPKGRILPRPRRIRLSIGAPLGFADRAPGKESGQRICDELREAVMALTVEGRQSNM